MLFLLSIVQVLVTFLSALWIGKGLLNRWSNEDSLFMVPIQTALGLLCISHLLLALVLLRLLSLWLLWGLFAGFAVIAATLVLSRLAALRGLFSGALPPDTLSRYILFFFVLYSGWTLLNLSIPPVAIDELTYHLSVPRELLNAGGNTSFPDNVYAYFPQLAEMLFLFGLGVGGEVAAKLFHAGVLVFLGLALFVFVRRFVATPYALFAVLVFLTAPSVAVNATLAYVDLYFAFYSFLSFVCLLEFIGSGRVRWAVLTGLLAGGAWATKYTGLQFLLLLLLFYMLYSLYSRSYDQILKLACAPVLAGLVVLPYLFRNWLMTGWPLFPFSIGPFDLNPLVNWDAERSLLFLNWLSGFGDAGGVGFLQKLTAPVAVFVSGRFGDLNAYDGVAGLIFLLSPLALLKAKKDQVIRLTAVFALLCLLYWAFTTRQVRFLFPGLLLLSVLVSCGLSSVNSRLLTGGSIVLIAISLWQTVNQQLGYEPFRWLAGEERGEFYRRTVRGADLYSQANDEVGEDGRVYLVNMGNFVYLLECSWRADFVFEYYRLGRVLENTETEADLLPFFADQQITHLMMNESLTVSSVVLPARERSILERFLERYSSLLGVDPLDNGLTLRRIEYPRK